MTKKISRRELLKTSIAGFGALSLPISLTACGSDEDASDQAQAHPKVAFKHGVASGDPLQDRIILWTRLSPEDENLRYQVQWEIAADQDFRQIINTGQVETSRSQDFTVKVDADRLSAGQTYFYRFKCASVYSSVGQTKTLATQSKLVQFAVCSCSNYPAGYFHIYQEIAQQDLDVVIHLGDYIYEYGMGGYATEQAAALGRSLAADNAEEIIKLEDYRKRYALYRTDADLQAAHQRHPFIVVWDDHELTNDTWEQGAENHDVSEGDFFARKLAALQAYFEWMPIRPVSEKDHLNIYRKFNFGDLVQLNMLDTRILARNKQLQYADYLTATGLDVNKFQTDLLNPTRTLLGHTQREWILKQLSQSNAVWNVLGQQVLMSKMLIPAEILAVLGQITSGQATADVLLQVRQMLTELVGLKIRYLQNDPTLTKAELARILTVVPYNLDAWDGYVVEREVIYTACKQLNKKLIVLAGDTHNAWNSTLRDQAGSTVGVELATSSVSSPGMEKYLQIPLAQLQEFEMAFTTLIDELNYCNLNQRGYLSVAFTPDQVQANWIFIDSIQNRSYQVDQSRAYQLQLDHELNEIKPLKQTA